MPDGHHSEQNMSNGSIDNDDSTQNPFTIALSSDLRRLLQLISLIPDANKFIGSIMRVVVIADASFIISDLLWYINKRTNPKAQTSLRELVDTGIFTIIAPDYLVEEIIKNIHEKAKEWKVSEDDILRQWEEHKAHIRFLPVPAGAPDLESACIDPKDIPYIKLQMKFPGCLIVTTDPHIQAMGGVAVKPDVFIDLRNYARRKAVEVQLVFGGSVFAIVGGGMAASVARMALKVWRMLPTWLKWVIGIGIMLLLINPRSRKAIVDGLYSIYGKLDIFLDAILPIVRYFTEEHSLARNEASQFLESFQSSIPLRARKQTLKSIAFGVLANAEIPMTTAELEASVKFAGYTSRGNFSRKYLLRTLRKLPGVVQQDDGKWSIRQIPNIEDESSHYSP